MENTQVYPYTLIRKNVKNINLRIKPDGSIVVSAHPKVPKKYIDDFVLSQASFIEKARARMEQNQNHTPMPLFKTGEQMPYLGGSLILHTGQADRRLIPAWMEEIQNGSIQSFSRNNYGEAVFCRDGFLYLFTKEDDDDHKRQLYEAWQKIQTGIICGKYSRLHYPAFEKLGVAYPEIKIRKMRSRWGSCIPQKQKITFNSLLLEKPPESIEYVVVHEFSHFIHPDHSKAFYQFVEQILPDWKSRKDKLK